MLVARTLSIKARKSPAHLVSETGSLDGSELSKEGTLDIELHRPFPLYLPDVRVSAACLPVYSGIWAPQLSSSQAL